MRVIAEGIETPEQLQLLQQAGCDYGQGYLFSKAVPEQVIGRWLAAHTFKRAPRTLS
jgi:EAL domain-containing protein (putative c-di-GMP-specific phosphodiesterase class I)